MTSILHITSATQWQAAIAAGEYRGDTLDSEGFIHCSTREQVLWVAERFFRGRTGLVLLEIDPAGVASPVKYELASEDLPPFPHIYGPLNPEAVSRVLPFEPDAHGAFQLP